MAQERQVRCRHHLGSRVVIDTPLAGHDPPRQTACSSEPLDALASHFDGQGLCATPHYPETYRRNWRGSEADRATIHRPLKPVPAVAGLRGAAEDRVREAGQNPRLVLKGTDAVVAPASLSVARKSWDRQDIGKTYRGASEAS